MQKKHVEWLRNYYEETQKLVTTSNGTFILGITDVDKYGNASRVNCTGYDDCGKEDAEKWENIVKIINSNLNAVALTGNGYVFSVGETTCHSNEPSDLKLYDFPKVVDIAKAAFATVGLKNDGTVVAVGSNYYGECNVNKFHSIIQLIAGKGYVAGLRADGRVDFAGVNQEWQKQKNNSQNNSLHDLTRIKHYYDTSDWKDVSRLISLEETIIGIKNDGTVLVTGDPYGFFKELKDWKDIIDIVIDNSSGHCAIGIHSDNSIVLNHTIEQNLSDTEKKELSDCVNTRVVSFVKAGMKSYAFLRNDGTIFALGRDLPDLGDILKWKNIVAVYSLEGVIVGLRSDGKLLQTNYDTKHTTNIKKQVEDMQNGINKPFESYSVSYTIDTKNWTLKRRDTQAYVLAVKLLMEGDSYLSRGLFNTIDYYANAKEMIEFTYHDADKNALYECVLRGVHEIHDIHQLNDIRYYNLNRYVTPHIKELLSLISGYEAANEYRSIFEKEQTDLTYRYGIEIGNLEVELHNIHVERLNLKNQIYMLSGLSFIKKMKIKNKIKELDVQYHEINLKLIKALET